MLALLPVLRYLGDPELLKAVEPIADGQHSGSDTEIRAAAQSALEEIRALQRESEIRSSHLRPANQPELDPNTLVRSSSAVDAVSPELLLRPKQ